jgi:hypothetical protein
MVNLGATETYTPKPGDIGITRISGWGGKGVRFGQWLAGDGFKDFEHVYGFTGGRDNLIVEAMPGGAREIKNWHPEKRTVYLRCPEIYRAPVAEAFHELVGTPYSWADYFAVGAHRLHIPAPHLEHYIETSGHLMCAQLADRAADKGGWHLFKDHRWKGDVTPGDFTRLYYQQEYA